MFFKQASFKNNIKYWIYGLLIFTIIKSGFAYGKTNYDVDKVIPAFPGAEGFGAETVGGRGGKVIQITNLNDTGTGSLRECVNATGARTCVFTIGGTITLASSLTISNPFITIAGQTAPGGGILLRANGGSGDLIHIQTHDVVVRYLSLRRGPPTSTVDTNGLTIYKNNSTDVYNIVVDHCSMSWTNDRILMSWYGPRDFTIQWSLFTEPLHCNRNTKGCEYMAKAVMLGSGVLGEGSTTPGAKEITFHHNLIAHSDERNPLVKPAGIAEIVSNVVYNIYGSYAHLDADIQVADFPVNFISNYFRPGPAGGSSTYGIKLSLTGVKPIIYAEGNIDPHRKNSTQLDSLAVDPKKAASYILYTPPHVKNPANPVFPVTVSICDSEPINGGTCDTYDQVVLKQLAGNNKGLDANGNYFFRQDAVDKRIFQEVINRQGKIIDAPGSSTCANGSACVYLTSSDYTKYGINDPLGADGWPVISNDSPYPPYTDSDKDGMSDTWEIAQFGSLNQGSATASTSDYDGDGYTDLEEFLNSTDPKGGSLPNPTNTPTPTGALVPTFTNTPTGVLVPTFTRTPTPVNAPTQTRVPTATRTRPPSSNNTSTPTPSYKVKIFFPYVKKP
jgi:pectate lyase